MTRIKNNKVVAIQFVIVFFILLLANSYTYYYADDYTYMYNFANGEKFNSFFDFFVSIFYHTKNVNGRFVPHFFAQIFLNLPKIIFNIFNSAIYTIQIILCYKIASGKNNYKLLPLGIFCAMFVFEPMFGEVNLWLTGSCNYLWGITINLLYIFAYVDMYREKKEGRFNGIVLSVIGFFAGAYIESASPVGIFISFLILLYATVFERRKIHIKYYIGFCMSVIGFAVLVLNPVQLRHTAGEISVYSLYSNFTKCIELLEGYTILYVVYLSLIVVVVNRNNIAKNVVALSIILFLGSVFSSLILVFASSIPGRALCFTPVLLICACAVLVVETKIHINKSIADVLCVALVPTMIFSLVSGLKDIHKTYYTTKQAVEYVYDCKLQGIKVIKFPRIKGETTYSVYYDDSMYQIRENPEQMPNIYMARFFDVDGIKGVGLDEIPEIIQDYS